MWGWNKYCFFFLLTYINFFSQELLNNTLFGPNYLLNKTTMHFFGLRQKKKKDRKWTEILPLSISTHLWRADVPVMTPRQVREAARKSLEPNGPGGKKSTPPLTLELHPVLLQPLWGHSWIASQLPKASPASSQLKKNFFFATLYFNPSTFWKKKKKRKRMIRHLVSESLAALSPIREGFLPDAYQTGIQMLPWMRVH